MMETDNIVLELLRAIRGDIATIKGDMRGLKVEMTAMRHGMASLTTLVDHDHGEIAELKVRIDRIERRLELVD